MTLPTLVLFATLTAAPLGLGDTFPDLKADTLSGKTATLPNDAKGKVAVIVLGFSHGSSNACQAWGKRFDKEFKGERRATEYSVAMIGGLGRLGKPFIESGMRKGMSKDEWDHMLTFYQNTDAWKKRAGFKGSDDAYVFVTDTDGTVKYLHGGPFQEGEFSKVAAMVRDLLGKNPN